MDAEVLAAAIAEWDRIGVSGPISDAIHRLLDASSMWWCATTLQASYDRVDACCWNPEACGWVRIVKET